MVDVNPDPTKDSYQFNPIERVTGLFDAHAPVAATVAALQAAGITSSDVEVFAGEAGIARLDVAGEEHGAAGKLFRLVESWVSDTSDFHSLAAAHLAGGGYVLAAHVGADEHLKARAMDVLAAQGATDVKYWHALFVEQKAER